MYNLGSAAKPIPGQFNPIKSPSAEIKTPYRRKGIVTDLSVSKRRRFDSKNRGFCSGTNILHFMPPPPGFPTPPLPHAQGDHEVEPETAMTHSCPFVRFVVQEFQAHLNHHPGIVCVQRGYREQP